MGLITGFTYLTPRITWHHTIIPLHTSYIKTNPFQGSQGLVMQVMVNQLSQQGAKRIYFPLDKIVRGYDPLDMVSLDSWRRTLNNMKCLQSSHQLPDSTKLLFTPRDPWKHRMHTYISLHYRYPCCRSLTLFRCLFQQWLPNKITRVFMLKGLGLGKSSWIYPRGRKS